MDIIEELKKNNIDILPNFKGSPSYAVWQLKEDGVRELKANFPTTNFPNPNAYEKALQYAKGLIPASIEQSVNQTSHEINQSLLGRKLEYEGNTYEIYNVLDNKKFYMENINNPDDQIKIRADNFKRLLDNNSIKFLNQKNANTMETENTAQENQPVQQKEQSKKTPHEISVDVIADQLKYLGFGEGLNESISTKINEAGNADLKTIDFPLKMEYHSPELEKPKEIDFKIHLNRGSQNNGAYFLSGYTITDPTTNKSQKLYLNEGKGFTGKEAFNLIEGRHVLKNYANAEGEPYKAWTQIDPSGAKDKHDNGLLVKRYDYDLKAALDKLPVKTEYFDRMIESLQKGNLQKTDWQEPDRDETTTRFVSAEPAFKNVNVFDDNMKKQFINWKELNSEDSSRQEKATEKQTTEDAPAQKSGMRR